MLVSKLILVDKVSKVEDIDREKAVDNLNWAHTMKNGWQ